MNTNIWPQVHEGIIKLVRAIIFGAKSQKPGIFS